MTAATARPIHGVSAYALNPATESIRKISSGAYATEDNASEANTGKAIRLGSRVWLSRSLRNGRPKTNRRAAVESLDTSAKSKRNRASRYGSLDENVSHTGWPLWPAGREDLRCEWL